MKKRTLANIAMVAIILVIAIAGVLGVGHIRGWFDTSSENTALLNDFRGIITLERDGVAYNTTEDTILRKGDKIACDPDATVKISVGSSYVTLGQGAEVEVTDPAAESFAMNILSGEAFVNTDAAMHLNFDGKEIEFTDTVACLSVRTGAQSICVYAGVVKNAESGQILEWIGDELSIRECSINELNDFNIEQIRIANENKELCFTNADLDVLEAERQKELEAQLAVDKESDTAKSKDESGSDGEKESTKTSSKQSEESGTVTAESGESASNPKEGTESGQESSNPAETVDSKPAETPQPQLTCTISIRCDTILNNWENLDPAKAGYVPGSGWILSDVTVEFTEGETVFDVLQRACSTYGIQLEYSWTPMYNSYYIEGINNLYEFDCGSESGWMYKVNGWFPNYGCSSYKLTGGESIVWCYTCNGLGADVGA